MSAPVNNIIWNMTRKYNFRCEYCYFEHDNSPVTDILPVDRIKEFLDGTGRTWTVGMTGGEPLIYPGFVDICETLTETHFIGVDTNLSVSSTVKKFAERIDPSRVDDLYVSLHIQERERIKGVPAFIRNARLLLDRGFKVIVNYVVHPDLERRYQKDCDFFASHGIHITPRPFRGEFKGRRYPEAYGDRGAAIFADHPEQGSKVAFNFFGVPCTAGMTLLRMEPDGTIFRCPGDKTILGNVMDEVALYDGPVPCTKKRCPCRGLDHVHLTDAQKCMVDGVRYAVVADNARSRAAFEQAVSLFPGHPCAENNLGVLAWRRGDRDEALRCFQSAQASNPDRQLYARNAKGEQDADSTHDPEICLDVSWTREK